MRKGSSNGARWPGSLWRMDMRIRRRCEDTPPCPGGAIDRSQGWRCRRHPWNASRKKVRTPRGVREILAPFPGCISFDLAIQGRRSRVAPGYSLKPLRGKSDTLLGTSLSTPLTLVTLAPPELEARMRSLQQRESFGIDPTLFRESAGPFCGGHIAGLVPTRVFSPIEKFSQARPRLLRRTALQ